MGAWVLVGITVAAFVATYFFMPRPSIPSPNWGETPTAEEGIAIPVLFGTRTINSPNITYFGDVGTEDTPQGEWPQGKRYTAVMQLSLCHGYVDDVVAVILGGKTIWRGPRNEGTSFATDRIEHIVPKLVSYELEGGTSFMYPCEISHGYVTDAVDDGSVHSAGDEQMVRSMHLTGGKAIKCAGVCTLKPTAAALVGYAPNLNPVAVRAQRIFRKDGGQAEQWYKEKAAIILGRNLEDLWKYKVQAMADTTDYSGVAYDDAAWDVGSGGIGNAPVGCTETQWVPEVKLPDVRTCISGVGGLTGGTMGGDCWVATGAKIWMRCDLGAIPAEYYGIRMWHDDSPRVWINGHELTPRYVASGTDEHFAHFNSTATIPPEYINPAGPNIVAYCVQDNVNGGSQFIYAGIQVGPDIANPEACVDMNPAHIVLECLTDAIWGLGYSISDVDQTAFMAAADTLYGEKLGMSLLWTEQATIEDFLQDVLRHISGNLFLDRFTGKFVLKLIRQDYDVDDLPVFGYSNVQAIEDATRKATWGLTNLVTAIYCRAPLGEPGAAPAHDFGLQQAQGGVVAQKIDFSGFSNHIVADKIAHRELRALSAPLLLCSFNANREAAGLNPGDPFVLDWPDSEIDEVVMRVTGIELGDGLNNTVKISAVEDMFWTPTRAMAVPAGISFAPIQLGALPSSVKTTRFYMAQTKDPLDCGSVACVFGNPDMYQHIFDGFTETAPGVWINDSFGVLDADWFDGVEPDDLNGATVFAFKSINPTNKALSGPYLIEDIGSSSTYARIRRHPDYDNSAEFVRYMSFLVLNGTVYGAHYMELATAAVTLGVTPIEWNMWDRDAYTWTPAYELLTHAQMASESVSGAVLDQVCTYASGTADFPHAFATVVGSPGVWEIQAGKWVFNCEGVWLTADPGGTTTIGMRVLRDVNGTTSVLFEVQSSAIHSTVARPLVISYDAPAFKINRGDRLIVVPTLHTTSGSAVTLHLRYNSPNGGTFISIPLTVGAPLPRSPKMTATFADGIITVPARALYADVTLVPGSTVTGVSTRGFEDGDILGLRLYGAENGNPVTISHAGTVPDGAGAFFMSSQDGLGVTYEDLKIFASHARVWVQYCASENTWQLMPGGVLV